MMRTALFALGGAAVALAVVLLANAATYRSRQIPAEPAPAIALDTAAAAVRWEHLGRLRVGPRGARRQGQPPRDPGGRGDPDRSELPPAAQRVPRLRRR